MAVLHLILWLIDFCCAKFEEWCQDSSSKNINSAASIFVNNNSNHNSWYLNKILQLKEKVKWYQILQKGMNLNIFFICHFSSVITSVVNNSLSETFVYSGMLVKFQLSSLWIFSFQLLKFLFQPIPSIYSLTCKIHIINSVHFFPQPFVIYPSYNHSYSHSNWL